MAEDHNEGVSNTPLDLLINAIAGNHYPIPDDHTHGHDHDHDVSLDHLLSQRKDSAEDSQQHASSHKRARSHEVVSPRQRKVPKPLASQAMFYPGFAPVDKAPGPLDENNNHQFSTLEVWHPTTGQKSYGKERRMLNPPPILRLSGPASSCISSITMVSVVSPNITQPVAICAPQTHHMGRPPDITPHLGTPGAEDKKKERREEQKKLRTAALNAGFAATLPKNRNATDLKDRTLLKDGLTFPGLWIGEEAGKMKEFRLELKIYAESTGKDLRSHSTQDFARPSYHLVNPDNDHETAHTFADMLEPPSMDALQPLAEAVQQSSQQGHGTLSEHFPDVEPSLAATDLHNDNDAENPGNPQLPITQATTEEQPLGSFLSGPIRIVSKPSRKTSKTRSLAICFPRDSVFSLWTRIHGQTVRTKWMNLEANFNGHGPRLTSRTAKWTPFRFEVLEHANSLFGYRTPRNKFDETDFEEQQLTYGSIVVMVDLQTGVKSDPVKVVRVESGKSVAGQYDGQPVSELQRIGLVRTIDGQDDMSEGCRWYLSAPGARIGGGELSAESAPGIRMRRQRANAKAATQLKEVNEETGKEKEIEGTSNDEPHLTSSFLQDPQTLSAIENVSGSSTETSHNQQSVLSIELNLPEGVHSADTFDHTNPPPVIDPSFENMAPLADSQQQTQNAKEQNSFQRRSNKTRRLALAAAVLAEDDDNAVQTLLSWVKAERNDEVSAGADGSDTQPNEIRSVIVDSVADWMSWTIGGAASFSFTFKPTEHNEERVEAS
ncbi:hypothetical protein J008_00205 [Cryptococcus neoformans]|nr:hypothetical protein C367_00200 [Cryptococcus neoformans var. grubii Ze90-1]OXH42133.1 hypothetical protein J008_00205 [Cryptococcus neoformans var. grubii]